jgi:hypothetical protein
VPSLVREWIVALKLPQSVLVLWVYCRWNGRHYTTQRSTGWGCHVKLISTFIIHYVVARHRANDLKSRSESQIIIRHQLNRNLTRPRMLASLNLPHLCFPLSNFEVQSMTGDLSSSTPCFQMGGILVPFVYLPRTTPTTGYAKVPVF